MIIGMLLLGPVGVKTELAGLQTLQYVGLIAVEVVIGLFIGLIVTLVFSGIEFAGRLFGIQMGFAVANVVSLCISEITGSGILLFTTANPSLNPPSNPFGPFPFGTSAIIYSLCVSKWCNYSS